jgi:hypothetical protein
MRFKQKVFRTSDAAPKTPETRDLTYLVYNNPSWVKIPSNLQTQYNFEELYFMLLVTLAFKTLHSISQNGISPITLNK